MKFSIVLFADNIFTGIVQSK